MSDLNVVLCGFMGTGKSTVGKLVARKLGRPFIDMDALIEERLGASVDEIFAAQGESFFRNAEAEMCQELGYQHGIVVGAGGGALLSVFNKQALLRSGVIVCLSADLDSLVERLSLERRTRPLLRGQEESLASRLTELLATRRATYSAIPLQVNTSGRSPEWVCQRVIELYEGHLEVAGMTRIPVRSPGGMYHLCLGEGLLGSLGRLLHNRGIPFGAAAVVANNTVASLYGDRVIRSLESEGYEPVLCRIPDGEQHKSLDTASALYRRFLDLGLDRKSPVLALGGGVTGDVAGFAAGTFMRGLPLVQVPTTLLAMVDSSLGGKTAVNLEHGKNMVGVFKHPRVVVADLKVLATLPPDQHRLGMAEVIKHALLGSSHLFDELEGDDVMSKRHLISEAIEVKADIVEADPEETSSRMLLNLGHTFGHGIERASGLSVPHGEAVAIGLLCACELGSLMGVCDTTVGQRVEKVLARHRLPTHLDGISTDDVIAAMSHDKKRLSKRLRFVVPVDIGKALVVEEPPLGLVREALEKLLG